MDKKKSVGGIWKKTTAKGQELLSITIDGKRYVAWVNQYKKDKQPDYQIYEDDWKPESKATQEPIGKQISDDRLPF